LSFAEVHVEKGAYIRFRDAQLIPSASLKIN